MVTTFPRGQKNLPVQFHSLHLLTKSRLRSIHYICCLLRMRYLAFNFIDFNSLRSACQISKSRQKIRGSGQQVQEKYLTMSR